MPAPRLDRIPLYVAPDFVDPEARGPEYVTKQAQESFGCCAHATGGAN